MSCDGTQLVFTSHSTNLALRLVLCAGKFVWSKLALKYLHMSCRNTTKILIDVNFDNIVMVNVSWYYNPVTSL